MALLMVFGVLRIGSWCANRCRRGEANNLDVAAGFIIAAGLAAALVHGLALAGLASLNVLRMLGWLLAALGLLHVYHILRGGVRRRLAQASGFYKECSRGERIVIIIGALAVVGLIASALGPPTDADSLNYHLGVPLDWLRHGGALPRHDWFVARLVGLGESLNMLGLAAGTDCIGAAFQAAGLAICVVALSEFAKQHKDRLFAALLIVACPLALYMTAGQKHHLLPAAATTVALVMFVRYRDSLDAGRMLAAFGCVAFAMGCRYTFLITGCVVVVFGLVAARNTLGTVKALALFAGAFLVFAAPVYVRNLVFYGDPLSPFLEGWRNVPDPFVISFAEYLREYGAGRTLVRVLRLPFDLMLAVHPGKMPHVLGLGVLAFVAALRVHKRIRLLMIAALAAAVLLAAVGQLSPRFFIEPYLWAGAAAVAAEWRSLKRIIFNVLAIQVAPVALVVLYSGVMLFPGALTGGLRDDVMRRCANGYAASKWLDETLPQDAVILTVTRGYALLPRPFVVSDQIIFRLAEDETDESCINRTLEFIRRHEVNTLVVEYPPGRTYLSKIAAAYGEPLGPPATFSYEVRNPWNRGRTYTVQAVRLHMEEEK